MADIETFTLEANKLWQERVKNKKYPEWFDIPEDDIFEAINILPMMEFLERISKNYIKDTTLINHDMLYNFVSKYGWYHIANDCKTDWGNSTIELFFEMLGTNREIIHFNKDFVAYYTGLDI